MRLFKPFKAFNRHAPLNPHLLPRDAGEDEGGGLNDLNGLNHLNFWSKSSDTNYGKF